MDRQNGYGRRTTRGNGMKLRLLIAGAIVIFTLFSYLRQSDVNPITGEKQRVALNAEQEIALGFQSAPAMEAQHGGLYPDRNYQAVVQQVGGLLVQALESKIAQKGRSDLSTGMPELPWNGGTTRVSSNIAKVRQWQIQVW